MRKKIDEVLSTDVGGWVVLVDNKGQEIARGLLESHELAVHTDLLKGVGGVVKKKVFSVIIDDKIHSLTTVLSVTP